MKHVGRYEVRAELGRGGFGAVYRAFDPTVGRLVAIKTLSAGGDTELLTRFRNEAASAGKLHHKNIVTIFDFGEQDGQPYIVMELLEGMDFQRVIGSERPLTLLQKMKMMDQVAEGLHHAHERGVVHRDVKPANMMLLPDGSVKIMDFGIALVTQAVTRLTKTGTVPGTLRYMAPEQFRGSNNDPASDIFSYAVTYYELLSNRHPFEASTQPALMYRILSEEPDGLRSILPECPEVLDQVLARAMHKDRDQRYQSFEDMQVDLRPLMVELQQQRSRELTLYARERAESGEFEAAHAAVREALELDPSNRDAVQLRRRLQQDAHKQGIRPRLDALLNSAKQLMEERRFEEAITSLEAVSQLERNRTEVQALLNTARTSLKHKRKADQLTAEAQRALEGGDLDSAYQQANEALHTDPTNPGVEALVSQIRSGLDLRARAARLQETLRLARSAMMRHSYDDAIALLSAAVDDFPNNAEVAALLEKAQQNKAAHERRGEFERQLEMARGHLNARRFADAVQSMQATAAAFPDYTEAQELLEYARQQHQSQRRSEHLQRLEKEVHAHLASGRAEAAVEMAQKGIAIFPEERLAQDLLQAAVASRDEQARRQAFDDLSGRVSLHEQQSRFTEALGALEAFEERHGQDRATKTIRERIEKAQQAHRRREGVRQASEQARQLVKEKNYSRAVDLLEKATAEHQGEAELTELLAEARRKRNEQARSLEVEKIVGDASELTRTHSFENALKILESGLAAHPGDPSLQKACDEAQRARQRHERAEAGRRIREAHSAKRYDEALRIATEAISRFGDDAELADLQRQNREEKGKQDREGAIGEALATGRKLLSTDETIAAASSIVDEALQKFPNEPALTALKLRIETRQRELEGQERESTRQASLAAINQAIGDGRYPQALTGIAAHAREFGEDAGFSELRGLVEDAQLRQRRKQELDGALRNAIARRDRKDYLGALAVLDGALCAPGEHPELTALLDLLQRRKAAIEQAVAEGRAALQAGDSGRAEFLLGSALRQFPDSTEIPPVLSEAQELGQARKQDEERQRREAAIVEARSEAQSLTLAGEPAQAVAVLERAASQYGAHAELEAALKEARAKAERVRREQEEAARAEEKRQRDLGELLRIEARAGAASQPKALADIVKRARQIAGSYPGDQDFLAALGRIEQEVERKTTAAVAARTHPSAPVPTGEPPKRPAILKYAVAGFAIVLAGWATYRIVAPGAEPREPVKKEEPAAKADTTKAQPVVVPPSFEPAKKVEPLPPRAADKPTGQFQVATGVRAVEIHLDGTLRGFTDERGNFRATLEARRWSLELKKPGYRMPPPQTVEIRGDAARDLEFTLTAIEAQLQLAGGTPGAQVRLADGRLLGTIGADGRLTARLTPGPQNLQITKEQFAPRTVFRDFQPGELVTMGSGEIGLTAIPKIEPQVLVAQEWEKLKNSQDPAAIEDFLKRNRGTAFAPLAELRLDDLRWAAVNQTDAASLDDYAKRHPNSRHRSEAMTMADALRAKVEMERFRNEEKQREAKKVVTPVASAAEKTAILATLERFEKVFANKSGSELKAVWPNIPPDTFNALSNNVFRRRGVAVVVKLLVQGEPEVRGNTAVIDCVQSTITVANGKPSEPALRPAKVTLSRLGNVWVIEGISR